ncbi:hypothetical protein [Noviherbaspirillum massiliense]|uniref:hypothetical protein n=1 Tax=Noviherbaspirillum massiliense TaxID=1465823 RepID=UPI0002FA30F5|nr:hypothetical protein [Noviherbaspirillum massiliense]
MKKLSIATLVGVPLLSLSSLTFAAEPASAEPMQLSAAQMDSVTAGQILSSNNVAGLFQLNVSPVTVVQISVLNGFGSGNNTAAIFSGNWSRIVQRQ